MKLIFILFITIIIITIFVKNMVIKGIKFLDDLYTLNSSMKNNMIKQYGDNGEGTISEILCRLNNKYGVIFENDIIISNLQIDHIARYKNIIFVIETKNWKGRISGRKFDTKWKQDNKGYVNYYRNPILQNEKHVDILKNGNNKYSYNGCEFINLVVFIRNRNIPRFKNVISDDMLYNYIVDIIES